MVRQIIFISFFLLLGMISIQEKIAFAQDPYSSTGVARHVPPQEPTYRALFGIGGNAGIGGLAPQTFVGVISYDLLPSVLTATLISNNSTSATPPRITYTEFDLLYGLAFDKIFSHYSGPSEQFHSALSAGISFGDYQTRWRNVGRRGSSGPPYFLTISPPNTSQYSLGVPIQLQAIYEPFRYVGMGALLFYTISTFQPSYGGAVVLEVRY